MWAAFEAERPRILGVLLDAVAKGLAELPRTKLDKLPRMAISALWATACETALWPQGTFWSAYCGHRDDAVEGVIDADPIAAAVRAVMTTRTEWTGTASELLGALAEMVGERVAKSKTWPDSPRALAGRLRRAATFLRKIGIDIGFEREGRADTDDPHHHNPPTGFARTWGLTVRSSIPPDQPKANWQRLASPAWDGRGGAGGSTGGNGSPVRTNPLKSDSETDADGADARHQRQSTPENTGWRARL